MKRILLPILLLMALLLPTVAEAYDFEVGGIYYDINGNEATVAQSPSRNYSGDVVIPSSVTYQGTTRAVTAIGERAFYICYDMTSISMPNTIKSIGVKAFYYCDALTSVTIPNSVITIDNDAFLYCMNLTSATIGNSVTTIGNNAFRMCTSLTDLTIGHSVATIGEFAFGSCGMTHVTIPPSVTTMDYFAFSGCNQLERVDITNLEAWCNIDFSNIDSNPLYNAQHLYLNGSEVKSLSIPSTITEIKPYAFYGCTGLTSVTLPYGITSIGGFAFTECRNITSVNFPTSLTSVGVYAFSECNSLLSISIPKSLTSIGSGAFDATTAMQRIVVNSDNPVYDSRNNCNAIIVTATNTLIEGCKNTVIPNTVTTIGYLAFSYRHELTSITIPSSVKKIESQSFIFCTGMTSFHVPASVTSIGISAFQGCSALASITVASDNPVYDSRNNCNAIIETASNSLQHGCKNTVIPNTVTTIGRSAFESRQDLTEINIPNSVTRIEYSAFYDCINLPRVHIPSSVTFIGNGVFSTCRSLTDVYCDIPDPSAITMGDYVFSDYSDEYNNYDGRTLHVPAGTVEAYQADPKWSNFFEFIVENTPAGDVDGDGHVIITDVTALIDLLLAGNDSLADHPSADVDGNGQINISDVTALIDLLLTQ